VRRILVPGETCQGIHDVEESGLVIDARHYYGEFCRSVLRARRYVLMAGWQFDSDVVLLRGDDAGQAGGGKTLLEFLQQVTRRNPELEVYILAWDFSTLYTFKREWFQDLIFRWKTAQRVRFAFDDRHPVGASHHQKLVVIDGQAAFAGGLDICSARWDDRRHLAHQPLRRDAGGRPYEPYHDMQGWVTGPAARELAGLFVHRWRNATGEELSLADVPRGEGHRVTPDVRIDARRVAVARTQGKTLVPEKAEIQEVRNLFIRAIASARELVYVENQYFTSEAVYRAFVERLKAEGMPKLQIVIVLPKRPHTFLEELSLGLAQTKMLHSLRELARARGHDLGVYYTRAGSLGPGEEVSTYIHAKLLLVDDRFLTVGSANVTNRSMGLDTELNLAWEAASPEDAGLGVSIRAVRVDLLKEHTGLGDESGLREPRGLVRRLNALAREGASRLREHTMETFLQETRWLKDISPENLVIDPGKAIVEENIYELVSHDKTGVFAQGITILNDIFMRRRAKTSSKSTEVLPSRWFLMGRVVRSRWGILLLALLLAVGAAAVWVFLL
jgi:phospholipase D1/2